MYYLLNQSIFLELLFDFQFQYWKKSQLAEQDFYFGVEIRLQTSHFAKFNNGRRALVWINCITN